MGIPAEYRMWWGGILIIILTMMLIPPVFGQPVQTEVTEKEKFDKTKLALTNLIGPVICILFSLVFFILYLVKGPFVSLWQTGLEMSLVSAFVMLLPISPMEGKHVFAWNKIVWAVLFFPVIFAYYGYLLIIT
jgi:Zn-dependent protease